MNSYAPKITLYFITPLILVMAFFVFLSLPAYASIVVEGDSEFTNDVNNCLNTYRGAPGVVGDVIKELEASGNEHKIMNAPDWNNTINDVSDAYDGTGTGTVTRVDAAELEVYKESFPELLNKDFCTALLHEMWHAVDADRGEWSSDSVDGVKENEIEATLFQNFIHAIRGVDPRTAYAGSDITRHVVIGYDDVIEEPEEEEEEEVVDIPEEEIIIGVSTDYKHVAPGSFSEIYIIVTANPNMVIEAKLTGPGVDSAPTQKANADGTGVANFTWRIVAYGKYTVSGTAGGENFSSVINVK